MKFASFIFCAAALITHLAFTAGCSSSDKAFGKDVLEVDMLADLDRPDFDETTVADVKYTPLDTAFDAILGDRAEIMGIIGDTVIVHDMTMTGSHSRLLLFNSNDGSLIRTISHIGNGPGEYPWIMSVVTDEKAGELTILGSNNKALRYTTDDRFVGSRDMNGTSHGGALPVGSAERGVHETDAFDGNLFIYQYDKYLQPVDTLFFPGYEPKWISIAFNLSDKEALINIVDTVFSLFPGGMEPVAVLSRGNKALTPEVERKVYIGRQDYEQARMEREAYIELSRFINDGPRFSVNYYYGGRVFVDTYSRKSGKLISRRSFSFDDENGGLPVPYCDRTIYLRKMPYLYNGRYYALVGEEEGADSDGEEDSGINSSLISWTIEGE